MFQNQLMFYETINFLVRSHFCNLECRSWIIIRYRREYRNTIRRYRTGAQLQSAKKDSEDAVVPSMFSQALRNKRTTAGASPWSPKRWASPSTWEPSDHRSRSLVARSRWRNRRRSLWGRYGGSRELMCWLLTLSQCLLIHFTWAKLLLKFYSIHLQWILREIS